MMFMPTLAKSQSAAVLVVSLIMLLLLTIIGVTAMQVTGLEETMAGNMRDRHVAFQAAEAVLRDAQLDINNLTAANAKASSTPRISGFTGFVKDCGLSTTSDNTDNGLCYGGAAGYPVTKAPDGNGDYPLYNAPLSTVDWTNTSQNSVKYGTFTSAVALTAGNGLALSAQPRYIIQGLRGTPGQDCDSSNSNFCYLITVHSQGVNPNTVVWLQTVYKP